MLMQFILLEPEGNPQEYRIFIFPHPNVREPVELLVSVTGKALHHPIQDLRWIGSLQSEFWELKSVSSLLDFLSFSSYFPPTLSSCCECGVSQMEQL